MLTGLSASADPVTDVSNVAYWMCKHHAEVRTIRVTAQNGSCSTLYSKAGTEKSVGSGQFNESCLKFMENIKSNLAKSGWVCRDITASRMTVGG